MNLVTQIVDQLSGDALHKLGSLLGMDSETAGYATSAAVPSLLAGLAGLASREDGARKVSTALNSIDTSGLGDFAQLLDGDASGLMQKGGNLLGSLLGENALSGLTSAIGNYAGLSGTTTKAMLTYLAPLVLGKVAQYWKQKGGTSQALQSLFAEQRANIADAVPAGFSLDDIPGLGDIGGSARAVAGSTRRAAEQTSRSMANWIVPLALLLVGGFLVWKFLEARPGADRAAVDGAAAPTTVMKPVVPESMEAPTLPKMQDELTGIFQSLDTMFSDIKDAASAQTALPQLEELNSKIDTLGGALRTLPAAGQSTLQTIIAQHLGNLKAKAMDLLAIPGLGDRVRTLINDIVRKLEDLHTAEAAS